MHYSIALQTKEFGFLSITPRKKLLKHTLLRVEEGLALVRLGKHEYALEAGHSIWLPFDCLTSISYFPQTKVALTEVSSRVSQTMPKQAGYVKLNPLTNAVVERLASMNAPHEQKLDLYRVLLSELTTLQPVLKLNAPSQGIAQWSPKQETSELSKEVQLTLRVREARRKLLSGSKKEQVVAELFDGNQAAFEAMYQSICGE